MVNEIKEIEKGLQVRFEDIKHYYIGYVSRIYKYKLDFVIKSSDDEFIGKGSILKFDLKRFKKLINNENPYIKSKSYIELND